MRGDPDLTVVAVFNQKGGVGKTTTVLNLLGALARAGHRPLGIDLDPQTHLSSILGAVPREADDSVYAFFARNRPLEELQRPVENGSSLLPGHLELSKLDTVLGKGYNVLNRLRQGLRPWASEAQVVIDCCPLLGVLSLNAIFACDLVLIPMTADYLALQGAQQVERTLSALERVFKRRLPRRYLLTRYDSRRRMSTDIARQMEQVLRGDEICRTRIAENVSLAESPAYNLDVFQHAPKSAGARQYQLLLEELAEAEILPAAGSRLDAWPERERLAADHADHRLDV
jgi:chromosome partitioning protein